MTTSSFGDIAIVYMLHLRHFLLVLLLPSFDRLSSSSCPLLVRSKACVGSIDRPFVLSSRRPFVFIDKTSIPLSIAVLFWSWSRRCHDRCGPIDRCFCSHRRVVFVAYTPTRLHAYTTFDRSCVVFVHYINKPVCVFVVVVVDNTSS